MGEPGITVSFKAFNVFKIEHAGREAESALLFLSVPRITFYISFDD